MQISYNHANPDGGNESFLLRFHVDHDDSTTTVLVDAGAHLDIEKQLDPGETLDAICLTHAHLDHYQSIEQVRQEETCIYSSPATATIISDVFDVAARDYDVVSSDETVTAIEPTDGWTTVGPAVEFHPIPAGHVPGAVGYLFRIDAKDEPETQHVLATGDFTLERAGGYPGFPYDSIRDVDVLFLTAATRDDFSEQLSEALGIALQQAHSGAQTLVTTSGLVGVQVAYLLDTLIARFDLGLRVRVVGQVAKIYDGLEYECDRVDTVPVFKDTDECLDQGTITVAGPEVPIERSSGRLFGVLRDRPDACVVQLIGSGTGPCRDGQCTMHDFEIVNHPSRETLETVHDVIAPRHTVIVHRHGGAGSQFNELNSCVWSPTDGDEYVLYADGAWQTPPWMASGRRFSKVTPDQSVEALVGDTLLAGLSLPELGRRDTPDLAAEGVDVDRVEEIVNQMEAYTGPTTGRRSTAGPDGDATAEEGTTTSDSITMATDDTDPTDDTASRDEEPRSAQPETPPLVSTTRPSFDGIDDRIVAAIEAGELSLDDVKAVFESTGTHEEPAKEDETASADSVEDMAEQSADAEEQANEEPQRPNGLVSGLEPAVTALSESTAFGDDEASERADGQSAPTDATGLSDSTSEATVGAGGSEEKEEPSDAEFDVKAPDQSSSSSESTVSSTESNENESDPAGTESGTDPDMQSDQFTVRLDPLTAALADSIADETDRMDTTAVLSTVATEATVAYLAGRLRETISSDGPTAEELSLSDGLERILDHVLQTTDEFEDHTELATTALGRGLRDIVGLDPEVRCPRVDVRTDPVLVDGLVKNESSQFDSRDDVVASAVRWYVVTEGL